MIGGVTHHILDRQTSQFSFNSSSLGYVRMLHGLTLYIFRQRILHLTSAEGLFGYSMVYR